MKIKIKEKTKPDFKPIKLTLEIESIEELASLFVRVNFNSGFIKTHYKGGLYYKEIQNMNLSELDGLYEEVKPYLSKYLNTI